jgi:dihydroorotase
LHDLVLYGGTVIDPGQRLHAPRDVAIRDGRIAALVEPGTPLEARDRRNVRGLLVVPGLIDLHVHAFEDAIHFGIDIDATCLARGVTTALDLGSCGALQIDGLRRYAIERARTRLFTLVHISAKGMLGSLPDFAFLGDLDDLRYCHLEACVRAVERHRDVVRGIKIRLTDTLADGGRNELPALRLARQAADAAGVPLVIHMPDSSLELETILDHLQPGDVLTHVYHGRRCGVLDGAGRLLPAVRDKVAVGLLLDVGHGVGSFSWDIARRALDQGLVADFISSDLHRYNLHGPVFDLVTTLDKFLHLGLELDDVLARATVRPARFLRLEGQAGTLAIGAPADVTVLELEDGEFPLTDAGGETRVGRQHLEPRLVVREGRVFEVSSRPEERASFVPPVRRR